MNNPALFHTCTITSAFLLLFHFSIRSAISRASSSLSLALPINIKDFGGFAFDIYVVRSFHDRVGQTSEPCTMRMLLTKEFLVSSTPNWFAVSKGTGKP